MKKVLLLSGFLVALSFGIYANAEEQIVASDGNSIVTESIEEAAEQTTVSEENNITEKSVEEKNDELRLNGESPMLQRDVLVDEYMIQEDPSLADKETKRVWYEIVIRLYNPNSGAHFYTIDKDEANMLIGLGWRGEGMAWESPFNLGTPVFRLYNPNSGEHFYTIKLAERNMLMGNGWNYEKVAFRATAGPTNYCGRPVYRVFNPNAGPYKSSHVYTVNYNEVDNLTRQGWRDEGKVFWVG